ncbi:MAG: universal stress protein [Chloroflexota bacterium]
MTTILVPLDGSELAQRAVPFARSIASKDGRALRLLRAINTLSSPTYREGQALLDEAIADLDTYAATVAGDSVQVETRVVDAPADVAILEAAAEQDVDLIVMSTHGRGGLGRWIYGSVADAILRDAPVPVLIVPPHGLTQWSADAPMKILVPLDGSELATAAVAPAAALADRLNATLVLGSVVTFPHYAAYAEGYAFVDPDPTDSLLTSARDYLHEVAAGLQQQGRTVEISATYGSPFFGVAMMATDISASMIVMATHGRGGLARAVMGSVATATLRQSEVPVLLVRPDELAREPAAEPATPAAVAGPPAKEEQAIALSLSREELDTLILALGDRFHKEPVDPRNAEPIRLLLEKLRTARGAPALAGATGGR